MKVNLSPAEYYKTLAKKPMGSGVLILNQKEELLLVYDLFHKRWQLPGGSCNHNESPLQAAIREAQEEVGLTPKLLQLACVEWCSSSSFKADHLQFVFYTGIWDENTLRQIKLQEDEIGECRFFPLEEALKTAHQRTSRRIAACVPFKNKTVYMEDGRIL